MATGNREIKVRINGKTETLAAPPHRTLLEALRGAGHVDVKCGCEKGDCGACAVLVDGVAVDSCLALAGTADGKSIPTVAGLGSLEAPHPLQTSFMETGAIQCGYCTPGMIIAAKSLLDRNPSPSDEHIREALSGNLCRCTGYVKIFDAIKEAAEVLRRQGASK